MLCMLCMAHVQLDLHVLRFIVEKHTLSLAQVLRQALSGIKQQFISETPRVSGVHYSVPSVGRAARNFRWP